MLLEVNIFAHPNDFSRQTDKETRKAGRKSGRKEERRNQSISTLFFPLPQSGKVVESPFGLRRTWWGQYSKNSGARIITHQNSNSMKLNLLLIYLPHPLSSESIKWKDKFHSSHYQKLTLGSTSTCVKVRLYVISTTQFALESKLGFFIIHFTNLN